jgi:hypothetical protein
VRFVCDYLKNTTTFSEIPKGWFNRRMVKIFNPPSNQKLGQRAIQLPRSKIATFGHSILHHLQR